MSASSGGLALRRIVVGSFVVLAQGACRPDLDDDAARADSPRVLAVRVEPAEARPGDVVQMRALYTDGRRAVDVPLAFSFCVARKALAESGPIAAECLAYDESRLGLGPSARGAVPRDACRVFGPDPPLAATAGAPTGRAADPDPTGGYYQPGLVRFAAAPDATFNVRIRCGLAGATQDQTTDYEARYHANTNPEIAELAVVRAAGNEVLAPDADLRLAASEAVRFRVSWPTCAGDTPCTGAERYVAFDPVSRTLVGRREALRVSWLATSGRFGSPRTGRDESDDMTATENEFVAPSAPSEVTIFVVLRDTRGGAAFRALRVRVGG